MSGIALERVEGVALLGTGTAFARHVLSNEEVLLRLGPAYADPRRRAFAAEGIEKTLGVRWRSWAHLVGGPFLEDEETTLDLAVAAARRALDDARVDAAALALIAVSSSTPPRMTATLSAALAAALGARPAAMDVRTGCAGGVFALTTAALFVSAGAGPALVVGVDTFSKLAPPAHPPSVLALGDGAGALVIGLRPGAAVLGAALVTDGALVGLATCPGPLPPTHAAIDAGAYYLAGDAEALSRVLPEKYEEVVTATLRRAALSPGAVDLFVPHQTSAPLVAEVAARAGIAPERTVVAVDRHANVGAAGWMVALSEARAEGRVRPAATVLVAAVGGGISAGALAWQV